MRFRTTLFLGVIGAALLVGCSKKEEAAASETAEAAEPSPEVVQQLETQVLPPPTANPGAPVQERLNGAVHPQFTALLHKFIETFGRMPESFNELASRTMDSIPELPPGLRYEIDAADKSVKIVKR